MTSTTPDPEPKAYNKAGFGVELEFNSQTFHNAQITEWMNSGDKDLVEKVQNAEKKIKGTALLVKKKPGNGEEPSQVLPGSTDNEWDLTAEYSTEDRYARFRGEYIINGLTVHIENDGRTAERIGRELVTHYVQFPSL